MVQIVGGTRTTSLELDNDYGLISINGAVHGGFISVGMDGVSSSLRNAGVLDGLVAVLVRQTAGSAQIENSGSIGGIQVSFSGFTAPRLTLANSGDITKANASAIYVYSSASIVNTGDILSTGSPTIAFADTNLRSDISNSGTIGSAQTGATAISFGGGGDYLVNTGLILGDVLAGAGDDGLNLRHGKVTGGVYGGFGNDRYVVDAGAPELYESTNAGSDTVVAWDDWTLDTNFETLILRGMAEQGVGNEADNALRGTQGDNRLLGRGGQDNIQGFAGDDLLYGNTGNDQISGGFDDDQLFGGSGNDTLQGNMGVDRLTGGVGADLFQFVSTAESPRDEADTILDFLRGTDRIDLSAIDANPTLAGDQAFVFRGTQAFTDVGQIRIAIAATYVRVDINTVAGSAAEMAIFVRDVATLEAADFVL